MVVMGDLLVYIFDGAFGAQRWIPWPHVTPTGHCNRVWASSPPVHILPFSALRPQKCWQSQINTLGVWTTHSLAKILQIRCSCPVNRFPGRDWNVFADFFLFRFILIFFSTWPSRNPSAGQIRRQIGWFFFLSPFFFLIEVFKLSKISHSQAFFWWRVCRGTLYSLACECVALSSFDWALPVSVAGDSTVRPTPFTARALKSKLTQTHTQMGSFFSK